eukprot:Tbor_TRINITY_DN5388_c3_g1::TRINITY_DN5388_c3_g1_i8::g.4383::m.4383
MTRSRNILLYLVIFGFMGTTLIWHIFIDSSYTFDTYVHDSDDAYAGSFNSRDRNNSLRGVDGSSVYIKHNKHNNNNNNNNEHNKEVTDRETGHTTRSLSKCFQSLISHQSHWWEGNTCMTGTLLQGEKLINNCKNGKVFDMFCSRINRGAVSTIKTDTCGMYASGVLYTSVEQVADKAPSFHEHQGAKSLDNTKLGSARSIKINYHDCLLASPPVFSFINSSEDKSLRLSVHSESCSAPTVTCPVLFSAGTMIVGGEETVYKKTAIPYLSSSQVLDTLINIQRDTTSTSGTTHPPKEPKKSRGILFSGDSMMRQLFLGIINSIRGETVTSEHYFHIDALYLVKSIRRNDKKQSGTNNKRNTPRYTDELIVLTNDNKKKYQKILRRYFKGYLSDGEYIIEEPVSDMHDDVVLAMMFIWDIMPSAMRKEPLSMQRHRSVSVHVASFMYWWNNKGNLSEVIPYLNAVERNLFPSAEGDTYMSSLIPSTTFVYVTVPWTAPKTFGGVDDHIRKERNDYVKTWIQSIRKRNKITPFYRYGTRSPLLLDFAAIAASIRPVSLGGKHVGTNGHLLIPKTGDNIHYGCIWTPKYPIPINAQKYNSNGCKDPMNAAVGQWLLHLLATR